MAEDVTQEQEKAQDVSAPAAAETTVAEPPKVAADLPEGNPVVPPGTTSAIPPGPSPLEPPTPVNPLAPSGPTFPPQIATKKSEEVAAGEAAAPATGEALAPVVPITAGGTPTPPKSEEDLAGAPLAPVVPITQEKTVQPTEQQTKALAALSELVQNPEAANAMLASPEKATEYFSHLAALSGQDAEKTKEEFALKLQSYLKEKEKEFEPQKKQMESLQKEAGGLEKQGQELAGKAKNAARGVSISIAVGAIALGTLGFFKLPKLFHGKAEGNPGRWNKVFSTVGSTLAGGLAAAFASTQAFLKPVHKKGAALQEQYQKLTNQAQQIQQQVGNQVRPAINEFIVSYVNEAISRFSQKDTAPVQEASATAPAAQESTVSAPQEPAKSSAIANILAGGAAASHAARAEEQAAAVGAGGRAA